jgi:hypothetical protein
MIFCTLRSAHLMSLFIFLKDLLQRKYVCTAFSKTSYKRFPLTNLNKYLHIDKSEVKVNVNIDNNIEKF